jgi:hypothetical protein
MKLYLLEQTDAHGYDKYDSCVVCAESEDDAKKIHPENVPFIEGKNTYSWTSMVCNIKCTEIGDSSTLIKRGVVLSSYNAG